MYGSKNVKLGKGNTEIYSRENLPVCLDVDRLASVNKHGGRCWVKLSEIIDRDRVNIIRDKKVTVLIWARFLFTSNNILDSISCHVSSICHAFY